MLAAHPPPPPQALRETWLNELSSVSNLSVNFCVNLGKSVKKALFGQEGQVALLLKPFIKVRLNRTI